MFLYQFFFCLNTTNLYQFFNFFKNYAHTFTVKCLYITGWKPLFFITRWENKVFTLRPLKYDLEESYEMLFELSEDESSAAKSKIRKKIN